MSELKELAAQIPEHLVIGKCLWVGNVSVDIDHVDNDLDKPLDYVTAFQRMIKKLTVTKGG